MTLDDNAVHPDLRAAWRMLEPYGLGDVEQMRSEMFGADPVEPNPRLVLDEAMAPGSPGNPPVRVKTYSPRGHTEDRLPGVLWIHGGGYILGTADGNDGFCQGLCRDLGAVVVSVDYRLAPEHPYPAALKTATRRSRGLHGQHRPLAWIRRGSRWPVPAPGVACARH